jgi:outer membrane protein assembly factor BamB
MLCVAVIAALLVPGAAAADDTTSGYSTLRTGWDPNEPGLVPSQVSASDFGRLFTTQLEGQIYAQPIVAAGVVVAVTEANNAYGLDPVTGAKKWEVNVGPAWPSATVGCGDLTPTIGATATPVYDPATGAVYFTAKVNNGPDARNPNWYMHALDVKTGVERAGFPTVIKGAPSNNPSVPFNPMTAMQRPGLLLLDGVIYAGFASHCDYTPYVGYIVGVNGSTGRQTTLWSTEGGASDEAGIWQSGAGLTSDGPGRIIVATGNGIAPAPGPGDTPPNTLGEAVVRLAVNPDGTLTAKSFFSPHDNTDLNQDDYDLGSGGPMALPPEFGTADYPRMVVQVGKDGRVYLLDADHLGGAAQGPDGGDNVIGMTGPFKGVWGRPGFWGGDGGYVYTVEAVGPMRALKYNKTGTKPSLTSVGTTPDNFGYTSGSPVITSTGSTSGTALVWVVYTPGPTGENSQLRAYDPIPVNGVLKMRYSAPIGTSSKFSVPGTDAGRVFVGNRTGQLIGFGRPTTAVLETKPLDFGSTAVGTTASKNVTVTATRALTVTGVSTSAPFGATLAAPVTLANGQSLTVPVTFTPGTWGDETASLTFKTDAGDTALDLHGQGTQPGLGATPSTLDFGAVPTGAARELRVGISNTGTTPETITEVTSPTGSFRTINLPVVGTVLEPETSTTVTIVYDPPVGTPNGTTESGQLIVRSDQGSVTVPLKGVALTGQPELTLEPSLVDFGVVPVGQSVTKQFIIANTGTVPMTITKAKAPAGVFHTETPVAEGQVLSAGDELVQRVTFTPDSVYPATGRYLITSNDGSGETTVQLNGNTDPIGVHYQELGGSKDSGLRDPVTAVYDIPGGGKGQDFTNGSIFWSPQTGARAVRGMVAEHYRAMGGPTGMLGYPITDELPTPDGLGWYNHFSRADGASIYFTNGSRAHAIYGSIRTKWAELGWELSPVGYPITDELGTPDGIGRYNHFSRADGGSIYSSPSTGSHVIYGSIRAKWASLGWENSRLRYPTSDEYAVSGGRRNDFSGGTATFVNSAGSVQVVYR